MGNDTRTATSTVPDGTTGGGGASGATSTDTRASRAEASPHMPGSGSSPGGETRQGEPSPKQQALDEQKSKRAGAPFEPDGDEQKSRGENPFPPKDEEQKNKRAGTAGSDSALGANQGTAAGSKQATRRKG